MTPTKILIGQILIVFAIMVLGVWAATQWAASMLGYQAALGPAWFSLRNWPLCRPCAVLSSWYHDEANASQVFNKAFALSGASEFLGWGATVGDSLWRPRQVGRVTTCVHGHHTFDPCARL